MQAVWGWRIWESEETKKNHRFARFFFGSMFPIASMYGIFTYIYHKNQPNVGKYNKYSIHGWYGFRWGFAINHEKWSIYGWMKQRSKCMVPFEGFSLIIDLHIQTSNLLNTWKFRTAVAVRSFPSWGAQKNQQCSCRTKMGTFLCFPGMYMVRLRDLPHSAWSCLSLV